jgi:GTP-binding protein HflX
MMNMLKVSAMDHSSLALMKQRAEELLEQLGAGDKPTLYVFNKCDVGAATPGLVRPDGACVYISAKSGQGVELLLARIEEILHAGKRRVTFFFPNAKQGLISKLYENATVEDVEYGAEGVTVIATVDDKTYGPLKQYDTAPKKEAEDEW